MIRESKNEVKIKYLVKRITDTLGRHFRLASRNECNVLRVYDLAYFFFFLFFFFTFCRQSWGPSIRGSCTSLVCGRALSASAPWPSSSCRAPLWRCTTSADAASPAGWKAAWNASTHRQGHRQFKTRESIIDFLIWLNIYSTCWSICRSMRKVIGLGTTCFCPDSILSRDMVADSICAGIFIYFLFISFISVRVLWFCLHQFKVYFWSINLTFESNPSKYLHQVRFQFSTLYFSSDVTCCVE